MLNCPLIVTVTSAHWCCFRTSTCSTFWSSSSRSMRSPRPLQLVHGTVTRYMVPLDELEKRFIQEMMAAQKQDGHGSADGEADGNDNESVAQPPEKVNGVQDDEENLEEMDLGKEEPERRGDKPDTPHESEVDNDKEDNAKEANEDDEQQQEETNAEKGPEKEDTAGEKTVDSIDLSRQGAEGGKATKTVK